MELEPGIARWDEDPDGTEPPGATLTRRRFVGRLAAAGFSTSVIASILATHGRTQEATPGGTPSAATPAGTPSPAQVLTSIGKDPRLIPRGTTNAETPLELVDGLLTPNELFFIRSNGPISIDIAPDAWRLAVTGLVNQPLTLSLADLQAMPRRTITAFLECSGNSRGRFTQEVEGTKWGNGAVGNAEWTGVSLVEVLNRAGVKPGAVDIVSQGGDFAEMQRGLPLDVAVDPDVMLVWRMNGVDLPKPNGGPVRLLVPGWGGIASTKWIVGLEVIDRAFAGHYNAESYVIIDENGKVLRPVREMPVKSVITAPAPGTTLSAGAQTIAGYAWSGYGAIAKVEISVDGGATWAEAAIAHQAGRLSWVRFEHPWDAQTGDARLRSRATDDLALQQPEQPEWNAKGYELNAIFEVQVTVG